MAALSNSPVTDASHPPCSKCMHVDLPALVQQLTAERPGLTRTHMLCSMPDFEDRFLLMHATACSQLPLPAAGADSYQGHASTLVGPYHCRLRAPGTALHLPVPSCCASHDASHAVLHTMPHMPCFTRCLRRLVASGQTPLLQRTEWTPCELCDAPELL